MRTDSLRITGATMKLTALVAMTIDHLAHAFSAQLLYGADACPPAYFLMRFVGRIAFPLYAFMIAEGCKHTKNIKKYMGLMALFAVLSEMPFDFARSGNWVDWSSQNVYFTLFLGLAACYVVRLLREQGKNIFISAPFACMLCLSAMILITDYSWYGVLLIWLFAMTENAKKAVKIPVFVFSLFLIANPWNMVLSGFAPAYVNNAFVQFAGSLFALILIFLYNGQRGSLRISKYFFYAYYPAHLLLFGLAANYIV